MSIYKDVKPSAKINHPRIYTADSQERLYSPFHLQIDPMERLLLVNFEKDPDEVYIGFEPQVFDDPFHGNGILVIAWRVDGRVDVYHQPSLTLNPDTYDIAGQGLADMIERPMEDAKFEVTDYGVDAHFAFDDKLGRAVEVTILETNKKSRKPFGLLAPMGAAATEPSALPLVLLHDFYFVRQAGTEVSIMVAGEKRNPDTLPIPMDFSRMYFMRYSSDPLITTFNRAYDGILSPLQLIDRTRAEVDDVVYDLINTNGQFEIERMSLKHKEYKVIIDFSPALPNFVNLADGVLVSGIFIIQGHESVGTVSGEYDLKREGDDVKINVIPSGGWQPNERKLSARFMYTVVPDFKKWPKTYHWTASIKLSDDGKVSMRSSWQRTV